MTDDELAAVGRPPATLAALTTPHCAAVHPLRLAHAVAAAAVDAGVRLHTNTAVLAVEPGRVTTAAGTVRAGRSCSRPRRGRRRIPAVTVS